MNHWILIAEDIYGVVKYFIPLIGAADILGSFREKYMPLRIFQFIFGSMVYIFGVATL